MDTRQHAYAYDCPPTYSLCDVQSPITTTETVRTTTLFHYDDTVFCSSSLTTTSARHLDDSTTAVWQQALFSPSNSTPLQLPSPSRKPLLSISDALDLADFCAKVSLAPSLTSPIVRQTFVPNVEYSWPDRHHVRGAPSLQRTVSMPRISEQPAETVDIPIGSALEAEESAVEQTDENACSDHFYFALLELLETERAYTSDLTHLVEVYFSELASASFISTGQRCAIVRNASQLLELHQILVKEIGNATIEYRTLSKAQNLDTAGRLLNKVVKIMDAFLDAFKLMRSVYSDFCSTHAEAMDVLKTTFSNRFQSAEFEKRCSYALHHNSRLQNKLDLVDYLIKPIQRICRYPLLFQALLKHAPAEHATIIAQAYRAAAQNATSVDEAQKQQDLLNMSKKLAERMMGDVGTFARREKLTLIGTGHVVVSTQDEGQVHNVRYLGLVLYQSCLVLVWIKKAKEYHPEQFLPLESLRFHSLPDGQSLLAHSFMISQGDNRFQIGLSCKQELEIWKQALTNVVRMYGQRGLLGDGDGDRKAHIENVEAWPQEGGHDVSTPAQSPTKASSSMPRMARLRKRSMSFIKPNESGTASQSLRFTSSAEQALVDLRIGDLISNNIQAVRLQNKRFPTRPSALLA